MKKPKEIKKIIHEAFRDVLKGKGIGLREATALDDAADMTVLATARAEDTEIHWWDIKEEWDGQLGTALSFTDKQGFKFLLPAAMTSVLDSSANNDIAILNHLCEFKKPTTTIPHKGHPEYTDYLRSLSAKDWIEYYCFTQKQVNAIALFLQWATSSAVNNNTIELLKKSHDFTRKQTDSAYYSLHWDDVLNNHNERERILNEWFYLGNILK